MLLSDCKQSEWYLVVTCPDCKTRQAIIRDPSEGRATIHATYLHQCDICEVVTLYEREQIERYQLPAKAEFH